MPGEGEFIVNETAGLFTHAAEHFKTPRDPNLVHGTSGLEHSTGVDAEIELQSLPKYGPYHRRASRTQSLDTTQKNIDSGELWGGPGRHSDMPMVQAHTGPLPEDYEGFEFYTDVAPNPNDVPWRGNWSHNRPGVMMRENGDYAAIPIVITRVRHGDIKWARKIND